MINVLRQLVRPVGTTDVIVIGAGHAGLATDVADRAVAMHFVDVVDRGQFDLGSFLA